MYTFLGNALIIDLGCFVTVVVLLYLFMFIFFGSDSKVSEWVANILLFGYAVTIIAAFVMIVLLVFLSLWNFILCHLLS